MAEATTNGTMRPAGLAHAVQGLLGRAIPRVEGPLKVAGTARYAAEDAPAHLAYAAIVGTPVAAGRIVAIDAAAARATPGVLAVIHDDPRMPSGEASSQAQPAQGTDRIFYLGQPAAVVVAETPEAARAAAALVRVEVEAAAGRFAPDAEPVDRTPPIGFLPPVDQGGFDQAFAGAAVTLDERYATPAHFPAALEPHATTAWWDDGTLTIRTSNQIIGAARKTVARALGLDEDAVRVLAPFVGGGFGGKVQVGTDAILAAIAAERVGRPVRLALPRRQTATLVHHRSAATQRIRIGCDDEGRIAAIAHEAVVWQNDQGRFLEPVPFGTLPLYAGAARRFTTGLVRLDLPETGAVRAPGEAIGTFAIECAMDELAHRLALDPIELRRRNEPPCDPLSGKPFSTRRMLDCYARGAAAFGWDRRDPVPGNRREGDWLIGMGMAAALRGNFTFSSSARVRLGADGRATVECDMTDIGTGTYTILAQVAGEILGLDVGDIDVRLGDTDLPPTAGSGGSFGAGSSGSAVALACEDIRAELARRMNAGADELRLKDGQVAAGGRQVPLVDLVRGDPIVALGRSGPGSTTGATSQASHGAQFAEVAVHAVTGEVRVRRMLGVFDAGRILNRATAAAQVAGGMAWGLSYALAEEAVVDTRDGRFVNPDFGEYHVAVHADVPAIAVEFIEEIDDHANQVGAKGVGELGISGAGAAVANAIFNATGVRVRDFPVTLDKLIAGLPPV